MSKTFVTHYAQSMLWASSDNSNDQGGDYLGDNYSIEDIAPDAMKRIEADCKAFLDKAENLVPHLLDDYDIRDIAHDFWLTRCGHGAGFWDGDYKEPAATQLTQLSKEFGNLDPYIGDDDLIYFG